MDQTREFCTRVEQDLRNRPSIDPGELADLFAEAVRPSPLRHPLLFALQKALLRRTLEHAQRNCRFYRDTKAYEQWSETAPDQPPDMSAYPVIDRTTVTDDPEAFTAEDVRIRQICHTSGTTGAPLEVPKSYEEVEFLQQYFTAMQRPLRAQATPRPLSLSFPNFYHGSPVPLPGVGFGFVSGVTDDTLIRDAKRVLDQDYRIPGHDSRITLLSGLEHHLTFFTHFLMEQGVNPADYRMTALSSTGGYLAPHWRAFLHRAWNCQVNDRFTMTETIAGAGRFMDSSVFVMDPIAIAEVIDLDTGEPLDEGVGALAITNLYPFVQMLPLIRYRTGDLVRRVRHPAEHGLAFEHLGRVKNCVSQPHRGSRRWLLFSTELHDAVSEIPEVRRFEWFSNVRAVRDRTIGSLPVMSVETQTYDDVTEITLSVELCYAPHCFPDRVVWLENSLRERLTTEATSAIADALADGSCRCQVRFLGPGALDAPLVIKV
jgi:phenylacetate-coenzyme A ligase PaaK-like adenylate-forming protein